MEFLIDFGRAILLLITGSALLYWTGFFFGKGMANSIFPLNFHYGKCELECCKKKTNNETT